MSRGFRADLAGVALGDGSPVAVMGVINVSPESFHAGSVYHGVDAVVTAALGMAEERAALEAGARVVNDVSTLAEPMLARVAAAHDAGLIVMAAPGPGRAIDEPVATVTRLLTSALMTAR